MPTIFIKDDFRASVEGASGGKQTVMYTAAGHPSIMNIIPAFSMNDLIPGLNTNLGTTYSTGDLGTGVHPAFIVNGVQKGQIYIGTYQGIVKDNNLLSLPNVAPTVSTSFDTFQTRAAANGTGWHMVTRAEWSAISLWCAANGTQPRGNNNYGRDASLTWETARRTDGLAPGYTTSGGLTLTGSGPASWRHDGTPFGISDLNGNVMEWCGGLRINEGEINILENNNAADNTKSQAAGSTEWKAISGVDGTLVTPGSANTVKYATSGTTNYTFVRASGASFEGMTNPGTTPVGTEALKLAKQLCAFPVHTTNLGADYFYVDVTGERVPSVGGLWGYGSSAGVFCLYLNYLRSVTSANIGSRVAYVG
jgi:hypothetical protein